METNTPPALDLDAVPGAAGVGVTAPAAAAPKSRGGRPPGSKTDPRKLAAARARKAGGASTSRPAPGVTASELAAAAVPAPAESKGGRPSNGKKLADSLALMYTALGGIVGAASRAFPGPTGARIEAAGAALVAGADDCGAALSAWADTSPKVRAFLTSGSSFGAGAMVLAAHVPIAAALLAPDASTSTPAASTADGTFSEATEAGAELFNVFTAAFGGAAPT